MEDNARIESTETLINYLKTLDNVKNSVYLSKVPEICKNEPCMLGVDEAGRGPVLGPMVYGISYCPLNKTKILTDSKCADSKQLNEDNRDEIFNDLTSNTDNIGWAVDIISPNFISTNMYKRSKYSLNEVSMDSAINLIHKAIEAGVNIAEVYVDTVGPPEKYEAKLSKIFPDFQITVAKKADSTYPIVSAASICAKVTRDHCLKVWKFGDEISCDDFDEIKFGSGYPGDPVTKSFLQNNIDPVFGFPRLVRFSWSTAFNLLDKKALHVEFDENDESETKAGKKATPITSFFNKAKNGGLGKKRRHDFFKHRFLDNVNVF